MAADPRNRSSVSRAVFVELRTDSEAVGFLRPDRFHFSDCAVADHSVRLVERRFVTEPDHRDDARGAFFISRADDF